jgi:RNA polymerase sigma-70 factor (ECF subfamily)
MTVSNDTCGDSSEALATFNQYRGLLFSIAYRMLGTVSDAEDMVQEAFIRWQQASTDDIRSPKAFLITIVSRLCINHLNSSHVQREEYVGQWLPEPIVTDRTSDPLGILRVDESLSMAFLVLLERLTPVERAVFLLREVFDHEYSEIAAALDLSEASCRQILRRAKQHVHDARPRFKASAREHDDLRGQFLRAVADGDLDGLKALLSADVALHTDGGSKGRAVPNLIYGADRVARALMVGLSKVPPTNAIQRAVQINGEPGFVIYIDQQPQFAFVLHAQEGLIHSIYVVSNPDKLSHLPPAS